MLCFQLCLAHYNYTALQQRKVQEMPLQSIQPLQKIQEFGQYMHVQLQGSHIALSRMDTLRYQPKELEHKGGQRQVHNACIVRTAVGKKAHLGMK